MAKYTTNYETGDLVTERTKGAITLRVVEVIDPYTVEVIPASPINGAEESVKSIKVLRNVTKGDPL